MTKSQNTKRALLAGVLSMMLCIAMLVGSTFAWFTDSVASGHNKIVAGNLDIDLEYSLDPSASPAVWEPVKDATELFADIKLWEPGTTGVVYFRLSNLGTLALKYKLSMNYTDTVIGKNEDGGDIQLSNILEFGIADGQSATFGSRTAAMNAVKSGAKKLSAGFSDEKSMGVTDVKKYFALVVYMPTTTSNEANYRGAAIPQIDLGFNLVATQDTVEEDSFNDQYDVNAYWIETKITPDLTANDQAAAATAISNGENVLISAENNTITLGNNQAIGAETGVDLNGTTQKIANSIKAENGQSLTMVNGTLVKEGAFGKVRFDTVEDSEQVGLFDGVNFTNTRAVTHTGSSSNATDDMIQIVPRNGVGKYIFKNCVFTNGCVQIQGLSGGTTDESDKVEVVFENCVFNNWGNKDAIDIGYYGRGSVTITGCTFNIETTSNVEVVSRSGRAISVTISDSTVNGTKVVPKGEEHVYSSQSVTLGNVDTISNVTYQGIATEK